MRRQFLVRRAVAERSHVPVDALGLTVHEVHGSTQMSVFFFPVINSSI
jgi:hypothetical protein